jgi:hypothetical protein
MARTTLTIRTTAEQAQRWQAAAQYEGARSVGAWLATLAAARLRYLGRMVPRMPLVWHPGTIHRRSDSSEESFPVAGIVAGPFGVHKDGESFVLSHVPTGRRLARLPKQRRCKTLARELAALRVDWQATDPEAVTGPDISRAWQVSAAARRAAYPNAHPVSLAVGT